MTVALTGSAIVSFLPIIRIKTAVSTSTTLAVTILLILLSQSKLLLTALFEEVILLVPQLYIVFVQVNAE